MRRDHDGWFSPRLGRQMDLLWFGDYGPALVLFPAGKGRYYQAEEFGLTAALAQQVDRGGLQLCCVDSIDEESWYSPGLAMAERVQRHLHYEEYLLNELLPYARQRSGHAKTSVFGASLGGFHAVNFASRHPELIDTAISFSGFFDLHRLLEGYWDQECYFNCPTAYIANMGSEWLDRLGAVHYVLGVGELDHLSPENREFAGLLQNRGIPCELECWPGVFGHDWPYWRENLPHHL